MKKTLIYIFIAALLGGILSSWVSPSAIAWYFDPPTNIGVNCRAAVEWGLQKFQIAQLFGLGIGAIVGLALSVLLQKKKV